jgi:hypothetical protein
VIDGVNRQGGRLSSEVRDCWKRRKISKQKGDDVRLSQRFADRTQFAMGSRANILLCLIAFLSSCSSYDKSGRTTLSRGLRAPETVNRASGSGSAESSPYQSAFGNGVTASEFGRRIVGGHLLRAENGTLVVQAAGTKGDLQPIGLATDAIITASVLSKLGTQTHFKADGFEVSSTNGVVSIHARNDSVDDAVAAINLTLTVPDVRQVIYALPTRV